MTRIKICGITNREDADAAIESGADALGFICVEESPRFVGKFPGAAEIARDLPPFISSVAVNRQACNKPCQQCNILQWYDGAAPTGIDSRLKLIRAFSIRDDSSLDFIEHELTHFRPDAILLDTYHKDLLGGSGVTFNGNLAVEAKHRFNIPIILAGGLTPENVGEAVRLVRPFGVDVSSGVEIAPGKKDHDKIRNFCRAVRLADLQ